MSVSVCACACVLSLLTEWHLGHVNESCAPWGRDFDTYIGYLGGNEGFYNHGAGGFGGLARVWA